MATHCELRYRFFDSPQTALSNPEPNKVSFLTSNNYCDPPWIKRFSHTCTSRWALKPLIASDSRQYHFLT
ncbi:hypothetical protein O9929_14965 [Vibrio lentus]|nr:hypothetical protein [Vibrio lentus]